MAEWVKSNWKITWDPDGTPLVLLDYDDRMSDAPKLPQQHSVNVQSYLAVDFPAAFDLGNVQLTLEFSRLKEYESAALRDNGVWEDTLALAALRTGTVRVEIQDGNSYDMTECALRSASHDTDPRRVRAGVDGALWRYVITGGAPAATV